MSISWSERSLAAAVDQPTGPSTRTLAHIAGGLFVITYWAT